MPAAHRGGGEGATVRGGGGGGCELWAESFDPRYSTCAIKSMARDLSQAVVTLKRMARDN